MITRVELLAPGLGHLDELVCRALDRVAGLGHARGRSGKFAAIMLYDVRELVLEHVAAGRRLELLLVKTDVDVRADREAARRERLAHLPRGCVRMQLHVFEAVIEQVREAVLHRDR